MKKFIFPIFIAMVFSSCRQYGQALLKDDFSALDTGLFSAPVGPHTEYHYLPEAGIKGNWAVSSFASGGNWGTAWQIKTTDNGKLMCQTIVNKNRSTHPMIVAGDSLWRNYKVTVRFRPENDKQYSGVAFRYKNDRCFYFLGIKDSLVYISMFNHAHEQNSLDEKILSKRPFSYEKGSELTA